MPFFNFLAAVGTGEVEFPAGEENSVDGDLKPWTGGVGSHGNAGDRWGISRSSDGVTSSTSDAILMVSGSPVDALSTIS